MRPGGDFVLAVGDGEAVVLVGEEDGEPEADGLGLGDGSFPGDGRGEGDRPARCPGPDRCPPPGGDGAPPPRPNGGLGPPASPTPTTVSAPAHRTLAPAPIRRSSRRRRPERSANTGTVSVEAAAPGVSPRPGSAARAVPGGQWRGWCVTSVSVEASAPRCRPDRGPPAAAPRGPAREAAGGSPRAGPAGAGARPAAAGSGG